MAGSDAELDDLRKDLRMSMIIAAFTGISWFIGAEINTSLFLLFKRRRGLYFWSAILSSWGVVLQPLFIILADYGIWTDLKGSIIMISLTWMIMVVPQSWLLYSRLHLIANQASMLRWIKFVLIFTSIVFSVPTIVMGTIAQATDTSPGLLDINIIWDHVQLTVFFVQETALSLLYIWQARQYLRSSSLLSQPHFDSRTANSGTPNSPRSETKRVLMQLIFANVLVIALDIALLGVQYAHLFYLHGAFKPCVYGVKLKVEFAILNRLVETVRLHGRQGAYYSDGNNHLGFGGTEGGGGRPATKGPAQPQIRTAVGTAAGELKWQDDETRDESGSRHEQIGLGTLDHRQTRRPSRSHSQESQHPIWDGQGPRRGEGVAITAVPATEHQAPWRQVYHR